LRLHVDRSRAWPRRWEISERTPRVIAADYDQHRSTSTYGSSLGGSQPTHSSRRSRHILASGAGRRRCLSWRTARPMRRLLNLRPSSRIHWIEQRGRYRADPRARIGAKGPAGHNRGLAIAFVDDLKERRRVLSCRGSVAAPSPAGERLAAEALAKSTAPAGSPWRRRDHAPRPQRASAWPRGRLLVRRSCGRVLRRDIPSCRRCGGHPLAR
jgi:hypothetical protein